MKNKATFILPEKGYRGEIQIRGFVSVLDEPETAGGTNQGPNPMENLMGSLAGCIALTLRMYANRKNWDTGEIKVEVYATEDEHHGVQIIKEIHFEKKDSLTEEQLNKLHEISGKCPVSKIIQSPVAVVLKTEV